MKLYTKSRDRRYDANAEYDGNKVVVFKGSKINTTPGDGFNPSPEIKKIRDDIEVVDMNGVLLKDVSFSSLSAAATFVTGRVANGKMAWKTQDGRYVRYSL